MEQQGVRSGGCARPPALDDLVLIAAVDGDTNSEVDAHLRSCSYCAERAQSFADLQRLLHSQLYRLTCPSANDLASFHYGLLADVQRAMLAEHLAVCPHCVDELRLLQQDSDAPLDLAAMPFGWLRRVVARPVTPRLASTLLAPLFGALRAPAYGVQHMYRADNMQITLDVERASGHTDRAVLFGLLTLEEGIVGSLANATVSLLVDGQVVNNARLDTTGGFVIEDIVRGEYSFSLRLPDREIVIDALAI